MLFAALPATSIGGNPLGPRFSGLIFGVALGLMIATHARLQRALPARSKRMPRAPRGRPVTMMPDLPHRIQPGTGRADLASTLGISQSGPAASSPPNQYGALVPHRSPTPRSNRPNIVR
jgi:hypothetical protein